MNEAHFLTYVANFLNHKCVFEKLLIRVGRFVPWEVWSLVTFCPGDVWSLGRFVPGTFYPLGCFVLWDLMSWDSRDVLSPGTFCLGTFCPLGRFVCAPIFCLNTYTDRDQLIISKYPYNAAEYSRVLTKIFVLDIIKSQSINYPCTGYTGVWT